MFEHAKTWVDKLPGMSQLEVAVYMIYGNYKEATDDTKI